MKTENKQISVQGENLLSTLLLMPSVLSGVISSTSDKDLSKFMGACLIVMCRRAKQDTSKELAVKYIMNTIDNMVNSVLSAYDEARKDN